MPNALLISTVKSLKQIPEITGHAIGSFSQYMMVIIHLNLIQNMETGTTGSDTDKICPSNEFFFVCVKKPVQIFGSNKKVRTTFRKIALTLPFALPEIVSFF